MTPSNNELQFILGHRGFRGHLENTLPAFKRALRYADGIEFDVRLTGDGRLVVLHDGEFSADGRNYRVETVTYRELLRLHPLGKLVPTLNRVLELSPKVMNADVKDPNALSLLIGELERKNFLERTVISTDDLSIAMSAIKECPDCRVGFSITCALNLGLSLRQLRGIYSIHVPLDLARYVGMRGLLTLLRLYRRKGLQVWLWNYRMNELSLIPTLSHIVNAVISDDPARLKRFLSLKFNRGNTGGG
ncbi:MULTISPECIES: glycerophosphodiester phosphodiesterase family protein [Thermococcus]|uniref:Glycerophosphoryl diester phosphodiesterase n=1 Tax=Thermococcus nautili TaxID=195522 RepID=W8NRA1_9EURY|nr:MULTISPECIES: glycerophosphodiester phosphodiesterase family protein [Thermococcus]AHL21708.1 Glycerophosphoryl diester phosphodiesterase [Thermococcus nautili]NJE49042.1 glycerophosphodiester phosphodiesterase [Thermococcus sp. 9N3]